MRRRSPATEPISKACMRRLRTIYAELPPEMIGGEGGDSCPVGGDAHVVRGPDGSPQPCHACRYPAIDREPPLPSRRRHQCRSVLTGG